MLPTQNKTVPSIITTDKNNVQYADVYFTHSYAQLYEKKENGEARTVYFQSSVGEVEYTFIKRKIPYLIDGKQYYDLTTAYGYGGPHIVKSTDSKQLMNGFYEAFQNWCMQNDVVSEFIRFHLFKNGDVKLYFPGEMQLIGHHVARDLTQPLEVNFHKTIKRTVRSAINKGVTYSFDTTGKSFNHFLDIYHHTMDRNDANKFYYFDDAFFEQLHQTLEGKFLYAHATFDGKIVSSFLTIVSDRYAYGFLGGTIEEYLSYNAGTLLEYKIIEWIKAKGLQYYVLGGGYRGDDGLYNYKKKFAVTGDQPFYIGKRIHNEAIYQRLVEMRSAQSELNLQSKFFPLYRA